MKYVPNDQWSQLEDGIGSKVVLRQIIEWVLHPTRRLHDIAHAYSNVPFIFMSTLKAYA